MEALLTKNQPIKEAIKRNIVSLIKSESLFDDLHDHDEMSEKIAQQIEAKVKKDLPLGLIQRGFHYTTAIDYPFQAENFQNTRYSDGSFGCWYGSRDLETTICETAYHSLQDIVNVEGINEIIIRERAVYNIYCEGILIDLTAHKKYYPELTSPGYSMTQMLGKRISKEGHPGLLAPSARRKNGVNVVIFDYRILADPKLSCYLTYHIDVQTHSVQVMKHNNQAFLSLHFDNVFLERQT